MRGHRWRLTLPFAGSRPGQAPTLEEIQQLTDQRMPRPVTVSDPTWLANFRCHRRSATAYRRDRVLLAGDAVHIHSPAGGQGMNTGIMDAHNLGWKLALVVSGRAPDALLDSYGTERLPVAQDVLKLTHSLVRYGTISHPVKRRVRDVVVPALGRSTLIQRRAVGRLSHVRVAYSPGPLVRQDRRRGAPRAGQRMPDIQVVGAGGHATTLHAVLRGGRHVLVLPAAHAADVMGDSGLRPHLADLDIVTEAPGSGDHGSGPVLLIRPDGHVAARGRPGSMQAVTGYLRDLFTEPDGYGLRLGSRLLQDDVLAAVQGDRAGADEAGLLGDVQSDGVPVRDGGAQPAVERDGLGVRDGGTAEFGAPAPAGQV
jgi:hypothetical protein